jgi:ribose transport system ATP-binding protein
VLERFGIDAQPETNVGTLPPSARAMLAIARALQDQEGRTSGVLVLDEPTAALPEPEVALLLDALRRYAGEGQSMLFVSHDLDEVLELSDRITVLRDGRVVATEETSKLDHAHLVELITGRPEAPRDPGQVRQGYKATVLEVGGLTAAVARDVDFDAHGGEILGLAGLVGSGPAELLLCIFGAETPSSGAVRVDGRTLRAGSVVDAIDHGVVYVPGERTLASFPELSIRENLSAAQVPRYWRGIMDRGRERRDARAAMQRFGVRAATDAQPMRSASGGNQQKVVLARWLQRSPRVILLEEPTQGVDVGARADIYRLIREAADAGAAVVVVSVDFEELELICDRALVVNEGSIVAELRKPHIDHETLTKLAYARAAA